MAVQQFLHLEPYVLALVYCMFILHHYLSYLASFIFPGFSLRSTKSRVSLTFDANLLVCFHAVLLGV